MFEAGLSGLRVVVSAGTAGIGKVIASRFLQEGAAVHVCGTTPERLKALQEELPSIGATLCDVARETDVDRLFDDAAAHLGGLDVLVCNAGIAGPIAPLEDILPPDWVRTLDVNLTGAYLCVRRAIPLLKANKTGSIILMSSTAGLMGEAKRSPYVASKWAMIGLTRTLAMELGPLGIRVNAVCPGSVEGERMERVITTEAQARGVAREEVVAEWVAETSLRRLIPPDSVANTVLFLCSPAASMISGQAVAVDGHVDHV